MRKFIVLDEENAQLIAETVNIERECNEGWSDDGEAYDLETRRGYAEQAGRLIAVEEALDPQINAEDNLQKFVESLTREEYLALKAKLT